MDKASRPPARHCYACRCGCSSGQPSWEGAACRGRRRRATEPQICPCRAFSPPQSPQTEPLDQRCPLPSLQTLYFLSSFFNQFGPNCTSFLVAGEVYPTDVRAFFHGISASAGKLGAILAASVFSNVSCTGYQGGWALLGGLPLATCVPPRHLRSSAHRPHLCET